MTDDLVLRFDAGPIVRLVMNQPERRNALSVAMMERLRDALVAAADDPTTRVVIISGAGPAFSAGHDLRELADGTDEEYFRSVFTTCIELMDTITNLRVPVIARVHGVATAAGCQLVAACDLAVAGNTARFATPGVNIGLFCSTPMVPLTRAIGRKRAMEMLLTGALITAKKARKWGLVNHVVPDDDLDGEVDTLARTIAAASPEVVALGKRAFYDQIDASDHDAYDRTLPVMSAKAAHPDAREGIDAFLAKRPPVWRADRAHDTGSS